MQSTIQPTKELVRGCKINRRESGLSYHEIATLLDFTCVKEMDLGEPDKRKFRLYVRRYDFSLGWQTPHPHGGEVRAVFFMRWYNVEHIYKCTIIDFHDSSKTAVH
ncbi:hypothetical protein TNCV_3330671 [Trichonephila clavipes]|nr:hypothetical protein TNCV_3330671 [Trichonephila clavipes]